MDDKKKHPGPFLEIKGFTDNCKAIIDRFDQVKAERDKAVELLHWVTRGEHHPGCIRNDKTRSRPADCNCYVSAAKTFLDKISA